MTRSPLLIHLCNIISGVIAYTHFKLQEQNKNILPQNGAGISAK